MGDDRPFDLILESRRLVTPTGTRAGAVLVRDGRIAGIDPSGARSEPAIERADLGDRWLVPGVVDTHVHVNQPGRTEWEGFETAGRAAAAGGVTTIVDMPLNSSPATVEAAALRAKRAEAEGRCLVDVGFWGGVVPGNERELEGLAAEGALGFKCFLVPSGIPEFAHVTEEDLARAMPIVARLGLPLLVHAEAPGPIDAAARSLGSADPRRYTTWLASRPPGAEVEAVRMLVRLCERTGCRTHVVHVAAAEALPEIAAAKARGLPLTAETCPHYLTFAAEDIADGATEFKCAPPIRGRANRETLWQELLAGTLDLVASDHSPCPPAMKSVDRGDFMAAWGGVASLELGLAAVWTGAITRGIDPLVVVRDWMSAGPARLAGLVGRKGALVPAADADLVVWDPDAVWAPRADALHQRHPITPYVGHELRGRVLATYVRGRRVFEAGRFASPLPGAAVLRSVDQSADRA